MGFDNIYSIKYEEMSKYFKLIDDVLYRVAFDRKKPYLKKVKLGSTSKGHITVYFKGRMLKYHRVKFCLCHKRDIKEGYCIDHIDGDRKNNNIDNLREVTVRENNQNKKIHREGTPVGAVFHKNKKKYQVEIHINKRAIFLGDYQNKEFAGLIYRLACVYMKEYKGDKAKFREFLIKKATHYLSRY